jgi:hypothetical protein
MFTSPPTYPAASQSLSSSVPHLPATIIFNPGSVPAVPSYLPEQSAPFLSQSHLSGFLSHGLQTHDTLSQGADLNSPVVFRRNLSIALSELDKLQMLARTLLSNMYVSILYRITCFVIHLDRQNAYQPGLAPHLSQAHIERLQDQLALTIQTLSQSGVGALPLLSVPGPSTSMSVVPQVPGEEELLSSIAKGLQVHYDKVQKSQENAAVVGNLLGSEKDTTRCPTRGGNNEREP